MKKLLVSVLILAGISYGDLVTAPTPGDLNDLPHAYAYSWGINYNLAAGEVITSAKLEISNVYNWVDNEWNTLWIDLLDNAPTGVSSFYDGGATSDQDFFAATGEELARLHWNEDYRDNQYMKEIYPNYWTWVNGTGINDGLYMQRDGGADVLIDGDKTNLVTINFTGDELTLLDSYLRNNGNFGFGIDADCHFYNTGFKFTMDTDTKNVPEPTLISLLGCGLLGLLFVRRRK